MIFAWFKAYRWLEVLLTVLAALGLFAWYRHSLIEQGARQVMAADTVARATQARLDAQQEAQWRDQAAAAQKERDDAKGAYEAYMASHPVGAVFVCHAPHSGHEPPQGPAPGPGATHPGTEPTVVAAVPAGSAGQDISAGLELIVRSAAEVAADYGECQSRIKSLIN